ncbi:MAG: Ribosomal small subunit methyltransferase [Planctomycetota bacterium]|jgi:16S rRNA (uracil1498-N3)-methyltransferase
MHWTLVEQIQTDRVEVIDAEAHHLLHVLRCKPGSELVLFDGMGHVADAVVESVTRRSVVCSVVRRSAMGRPWAGGLTVAVSPPKGDRLRWMVEKLTELGVQTIKLLRCARTVTDPGDTRLEKLRSTAAAACKQSRRAWLPEIEPFSDLRVLVEQVPVGEMLYLAHPPADLSGGLSPGILEPQPQVSAGPAIASGSSPVKKLLLIGPEGGFTEEELGTAIVAGGQLIHWPHSVLRTETAAIVFSALLLRG